jgi:arginyl-tRNA synthetase
MNILKQCISEILSKNTNMGIEGIFALLSVPPQPKMGDIAFPCFKAAKEKNPVAFAKGLAELLKQNMADMEFIEEVKNFGPYVNFFLSRKKFFVSIVSDIAKNGIASCRKPDKGTIVIDYSSPNIAKPIAFHHIRSTVIGNILGNIMEHCGYNVVRINYLDDWGTQFGKMITAFLRYGNDDALDKEGVKHLMDIYVKYHKELTPELEETARAWFKKTEEGDEEALGYWKRFKDISIVEFNRIYKRLNVKFTNVEGESFYNSSVDNLVNMINKTIGTKESDGALVVDMSGFEMPPVLLKKTDGTTLYATRDLAAAIDRYERFNFDESLYVVAHQQELHFKQIFKVLELMGYDWCKNCKHIYFGMLLFEDAKMSTREGNIIFLEDVLNKSVELAMRAIMEKNPGLENKEEVAEDIGVGAVIFGDISKRRIQNITFKWEEVLNFDGETAPYIQYTHARACSILRKADFNIKDVQLVTNYEPMDLEFELAKHISMLDEKIDEARIEYEPFVVARYLLDLCKVFNKYYYEERIIDIEDAGRKAIKLSLIYAARETISYGLSILGIRSPDRM